MRSMMIGAAAVLALSLQPACGGDSPQPGGEDGGSGGPDAGEGGGYPGTGDDLDVATGCAGVYNPDQLLDFHLTMAAGDWSTVRSDSTNSVYAPADLRCGDGPTISVGVRRKRSGSAIKPGLKVDINHYVAGQAFHGLKKLSWENGISEGGDTGETGDVMSEYLAWRLMAVSGAITGRAAFIRVHVNGELLGVYVSVEQVDKSFLKRFVGNDSGWLWKYSGSDGDGQKTNEGTEDPFMADLCYLERNGCAIPSDAQLAEELPGKLDIQQILTVGAVNALVANTDSPLLKFNNYIFYNWTGPRLYFPWDLDTVMKSDYDVFTGSVSGGSTVFLDVLFSNWEQDYDDIFTELLAGPLTLSAIEAEIDRAVEVAGDALEADPHMGGGATSAATGLSSWWSSRHASVSQQVADH